MAFSLFPKQQRGYAVNKYSCARWGKDRNLVTTDHGSWALLNDSEFRLLRTMKVEEDPALFSVLEDRGVVVTERNMESVANDYRERFHFLGCGPTLHIVVPTMRCNQKCVYCHSRSQPPASKGYDMDEKTAKSVVDFIFTSTAKILVIELQGGDCSLNFGTVKCIIEHARELADRTGKKVKFSVVTNLTAMTDEMLGFLKESRIMGLSTSLDGPKHVHDANRKYIDGKGTYDDVVYWIRKIKSEFKQDFNLNAMTTVTRFSLPYAKEIVDEFVELGFGSVWLRFLNNLGFASQAWQKIGYTPEEYIEFWKAGLSHVLEVNRHTRFKEIYASLLARKILFQRDQMFVDIQSPCGAGIGQLLYDHTGDIFTCDEAKVLGDTFKLGNVRTSTFQEVMSHPTVASMATVSSKLTTLCDACVYSPYCGLCPVEAFTSHGSIIPKLAESFRCKVFKAMIEHVFRQLTDSERSRQAILEWVSEPL